MAIMSCKRNGNEPYCACAVAVRVGADVFKYSLCDNSNLYADIVPCGDGIIDVRTNDGLNFDVSFKNGYDDFFQ